MRKILFAAATFSLVVSLAACNEKPAPDQGSTVANTADAKPDFVMRPLKDPGKVEVKIIGGKVAVPSDYPATLTIDGGNCTATVVGSQAVLTAAHCIQGSGNGKLDIAPVPITLQCKVPTEYPPAGVCEKNGMNSGCGRDVAMCHASMPIPLGANVKYEVVASKPAQIPSSGTAVILGYGCTAAGQSPASILYWGKAPVTAGPVEGGQSESQFIKLVGGPILCPGDSGGGAFDVEAIGSRVVIGINSSSNIPNKASYLAPILWSNRSFLENWAKTNNAPICGITPGAQNCRH